jgi:hypothetical protein
MLQKSNFQKFFFSISFIIISCSNQQKKDTTYLNNYLLKIFNLKIKSTPTDYIIVSNNSCESCSNLSLEFALANKDTNKIFILPIQFKYLQENKLEYPNNILIDTTNAIDKLKFHKGNICKIITSNGEIDSVIVYDLNNIESIIH